MTAGWVASTVRGRALLRRSVGVEGVRAIADADTWQEARTKLRSTPYGERVSETADRSEAHHHAAATTLWHLRVLAGWLPPDATVLTRLAAGPFEMANIERHVAGLTGTVPDRGRSDGPYALGSLAAAWPRIATATSGQQVRAALSGSVWGDPGGTDEAALALGVRVGWARRLLHASPIARPWASGMLTVLAARDRFAFERPIAEVTGREFDRALGHGWRSASTLAELATRVPDSASWVLGGIEVPAGLWRAELAIIRRVAADAEPLARSGRYGRDTMVAVLALLLVDLWRMGAAIEAAGRGATGREVFDAVAA